MGPQERPVSRAQLASLDCKAAWVILVTLDFQAPLGRRVRLGQLGLLEGLEPKGSLERLDSLELLAT
jgi:hypothetical protein